MHSDRKYFKQLIATTPDLVIEPICCREGLVRGAATPRRLKGKEVVFLVVFFIEAMDYNIALQISLQSLYFFDWCSICVTLVRIGQIASHLAVEHMAFNQIRNLSFLNRNKRSSNCGVTRGIHS